MPAVSTNTFAGIGVPPRVLSALAVDHQRVRVVFSELMGGAALLSAGNYTITEDMGSAARTVAGVTVEGSAPSSSVLLLLDGPMTLGVDNYNVAAAASVADLAGNGLEVGFRDADFDGRSAAPGVLDHCALGIERLATQFRHKPRIEALVCALASRWAGPDQALSDIQAFRAIGTGVGAQLDAIGDLLDLLRHGLTDDVYRTRLQAKALANASDGYPDQLLAILLALDVGFDPSEVSYTREPHATALMHCQVPQGSDALGPVYVERFLAPAAMAGVRLILEYEEQGPTLFTWRLSDGSLDGGLPANSGWGEGIWARAVDAELHPLAVLAP